MAYIIQYVYRGEIEMLMKRIINISRNTHITLKMSDTFIILTCCVIYRHIFFNIYLPTYNIFIFYYCLFTLKFLMFFLNPIYRHKHTPTTPNVYL